MFIKKESVEECEDFDPLRYMQRIDSRNGRPQMDISRESCRSLVCDRNGIIIAEMVYRCMLCASISESVSEAQTHYQVKHIDSEIVPAIGNHEPNVIHNKEDSDPNEDFPEDDELASESMLSCDVSLEIKSPQENFQSKLTTKPFSKRSSLVPQMSSVNIMAANALAKAKNTLSFQSGTRGGFVTCAVCNITKFYASVQRRYGQFTCMGCAKFFGRFLLKPKKYCCPNLGSCPLDATPRCKACLLQACIDTYNIDEKRMKVINAHRPIKKLNVPRQPSNSPLFDNTNSSESEMVAVEGADVSSLSLGKTSKNNLLKPMLNADGSGSASNNAAVLAMLRSTVKKNWGCRKCSGCLVEDCGKCNYCLDKPKFGGPNTLKKKCVQRKCIMQEQQKEHGNGRYSKKINVH